LNSGAHGNPAPYIPHGKRRCPFESPPPADLSSRIVLQKQKACKNRKLHAFLHLAGPRKAWHDIFGGNMEAPLLRVEKLRVRFEGQEHSFDALRGISFTIRSGSTFCLVGESGCGKSMCAKAVLGLLPPPGRIAAGSIRLSGRELCGLPEKELRRIRGTRVSMIFQEPMSSLNPVLNVGLQVAETLMQHRGLSYSPAMERAVELFRQVGIPSPEERSREYPHQLSGGMRQRVMTAIALACGPDLLLADEPTTALDATIQGQILSLMKELARERGMGLLLITHDLGVVAQTADDVGVMYAGGMVECAPADSLLAGPLHPYTAGLMRSAPDGESMRLTRLPAIAGAVPPLHLLPAGCAFAPRCAEALPRCAEEEPPPVEARPGHEVRCWLYSGNRTDSAGIDAQRDSALQCG
jgi:peptide/nickel transport system ATP-binding protein